MWREIINFVVITVVALFVFFLSYRIAKILGHWEYGVLVFFVVGYLWNISENTRKKAV